MVLETYNTITVNSYMELYRMYRNGEICYATDQTITENLEFDYSEKDDLVKINDLLNLLNKDQHNVYTIEKVKDTYVIKMHEMSIEFDVNETLKQGGGVFLHYSEAGINIQIKNNETSEYFDTSSLEVKLNKFFN